MGDFNTSTLNSLIRESIQCTQKKEEIFEKILQSQRDLRENMELRLKEVESLYDTKMSRVEKNLSTSRDTIETLQGLVETQRYELEALESSNNQIEARLSELQRSTEEKKMEAKSLVHQKRQSIGCIDEMSSSPAIQAYKLRSYLYSITNLAWHKKKLKCYSVAPDEDDIQMFSIENAEGALEKEGALIWKHISYDPVWDHI